SRFRHCDGTRRPAVGSRRRSRENMVAVNADVLVRLTRAVLPARSPTPVRYRLPLWSPTTATAIADRPARANSSSLFLIVTFSPVEGPVDSIWLGRNGFTPSFMDDLYCPR